MKIELYSLNDTHAGKIKEFLQNNKLLFKEIPINYARFGKSYLKITYSHSTHMIDGFQEHALVQLIEHINKYHPKIAI
jgi:hypothetical protein